MTLSIQVAAFCIGTKIQDRMENADYHTLEEMVNICLKERDCEPEKALCG